MRKNLSFLLTVGSLLTAMGVSYVRNEEMVGTLKTRMDQRDAKCDVHLADRDIHVDPRRDTARWDDMIDRLRDVRLRSERLEQEIMRIKR